MQCHIAEICYLEKQAGIRIEFRRCGTASAGFPATLADFRRRRSHETTEADGGLSYHRCLRRGTTRSEPDRVNPATDPSRTIQAASARMVDWLPSWIAPAATAIRMRPCGRGTRTSRRCPGSWRTGVKKGRKRRQLLGVGRISAGAAPDLLALSCQDASTARCPVPTRGSVRKRGSRPKTSETICAAARQVEAHAGGSR